MRGLQIVPLLARGTRSQPRQAPRSQRPQRVIDLLRRRLIGALGGPGKNGKDASDTRRIGQNKEHQRRNGHHEETTKPALGQSGDPRGAEGTHRHDHRGSHVAAQHDRTERDNERQAHGNAHRLDVGALRRRLRDHERQEDDEGEFEQLRGLSHDGADLDPVRVSALGPAQRAQNEALEDEGGTEDERGQAYEPTLRNQLNEGRDQQRDEDDEQRTRVRRVGVLSLRNGGDRLGGKAHDEPEDGQQQRRDDDQVVGGHRAILSFAARAETYPRERHRGDVPSALIRRHRHSPTGRAGAQPHRRTRPRAGHSCQTGPTTRTPGQTRPCRRAETGQPPR